MILHKYFSMCKVWGGGGIKVQSNEVFNRRLGKGLALLDLMGCIAENTKSWCSQFAQYATSEWSKLGRSVAGLVLRDGHPIERCCNPLLCGSDVAACTGAASSLSGVECRGRAGWFCVA